MRRESSVEGQKPHRLLDVLQKERASTEIVDWTVKEALDFFLMQIHCDHMVQSRPAHHLGHQFGHDAAPLAHFTYENGNRMQTKKRKPSQRRAKCLL